MANKLTPMEEFNRRSKEQDDSGEENNMASGEISLDDVAKVLSLTIRDDDSNKKIVFLCMLSAFTEDSQINVSLNAPSSTGKTYLVSEVAKLFPKEDKIEKSGASPTSFFYADGVEDPITKAKVVDLERKILIFYEMPNPLLQEKLRAMMSKDDKELIYSFTNKTKGRNKTDDVVIRGFSATLFCSAGLRLDEQEATRAILLSPEASEAKIKQGINMRVKRAANGDSFKDALKWNYDRQMLMARIVAIRNARVMDIVVPNSEAIEKKFLSIVGILKPRHQRDIAHLMELIKAITLLNVWHRTNAAGEVLATQSDIDEAFKLWQEFFESQNLNVSPVVLETYKKFILPAYLNKFAKALKSDKALWNEMKEGRVGITAQEVSNYYRDIEGTALNGEQLRKEMLPQLANAGLITWEKPLSDDEDKRTRHIICMTLTDDNKKYVGTYEVVKQPLSSEW